MARSRSSSRTSDRPPTIGSIFQRLNPFRLRDRLPRRRRSRKLRALILAALAFWLTWPFFALGNVVGWVTRQAVWFWKARQFRRLLWGTPFLLVVIAWGYLLVASSLNDPRQLEQQYSEAARTAYMAGNFDIARLYTERVARSRPNDHELMFRLASIYATQGEAGRSEAIMNRLAPADRSVYAPAHLARAQQLLGRAIDEADLAKFQSAQTQLLQAAAADPKNPNVRAALGAAYFRLGWWREAEENLRLAVGSMPDLYLMFAKVSAFQGNRDQAALYGRRAESHYRRLLAENPLDHRIRMTLADALAFLEQFEQAIIVLQQGVLLQEVPEMHEALAKIYLLWAETVGDETTATRRRQLQLLEEGLQHNPQELGFFQQILRLLNREGETSEKMRTFLANNLARGEARLLSHLALGTHEAERGRIEQAVLHLQQAHELNPQLYAVANNLAWVFSEAKPPQIDRALALINTALEIHPDMPEMLDTRGNILVKKGDYRAALRDLEAALPSLRGNRRTHEALAECYRNLGSAELAEQHAAIARRLATDLEGEER